jgi:phosphatidylinositol-3-phosphatase
MARTKSANTHSSDLRTMQEIFRVGPFIRDAANANDLSDLFDPGAIPKKP